MHYQSTIYIKEDLFCKLMEVVKRLNTKRSTLVESLLIRYMDKKRIYPSKVH